MGLKAQPGEVLICERHEWWSMSPADSCNICSSIAFRWGRNRPLVEELPRDSTFQIVEQTETQLVIRAEDGSVFARSGKRAWSKLDFVPMGVARSYYIDRLFKEAQRRGHVD